MYTRWEIGSNDGCVLRKIYKSDINKAKEINGSDMAFDFGRGWLNFINHLKYVTCYSIV